FDNMFTAAGGASLNANTWMHRTMYMVTLPANKLELFYWVEADRLSNAVFRQFYKERDVVLDERLRSVENLSSGRIFESALASISEGCTLGSPVLGWPSDMRRYTRPQQLAFWRTFYRPDNAAIVLVGKVDAGEALSLAKRYFGAIPRPETELPRRVKRNENPVGRRKFVGHHDSTPQVALAWSTPGAADAHYVPLDMLARLLNLQSGPLHKRLVDTSKAEGVGVSFYGSKESGMFVIVAVPMAGVSLESIQKEMEQLLEEVRLGGILKEDFESARSQIIVEQTAILEQSENLASLLCESFANGDWRALFENNVRAASLTVDDLARSASAALPANHATLLLALKSDSNVPATPPLLEIPGVPEAGTDTVEIARAAIAEAEKRFDADHFEARQWYDGLAARAIYRQAR
ncbi:MAG: insulinase family protein, partial [Planctomycetes bacterium]|nr:insulinase family protein [Planctomycetota bacterium]